MKLLTEIGTQQCLMPLRYVLHLLLYKTLDSQLSLQLRIRDIHVVPLIAGQAIIDGFHEFHPQLPLLQRGRQIFDGLLIGLMIGHLTVVRGRVARHQRLQLFDGGMTVFEFFFAHRTQHTSTGESGNPHRQQQSGGDSGGPWFLPFDCPLNHNLRWQQCRVNSSLLQGLQGESIRDRKSHDVVNEQWVAEYTVAGDTFEFVQTLHGIFQVLLEELLQPGHLKAVSDADHFCDFGCSIDAAEVADRALDFGHVVIEDRPHGLKNSFRIRSFCGVAFEVFGFGKCELHFTSQRSSKMVAANRHVANPDTLAI